MKPSFQREMSYFQLQKKKPRDSSKSNKRKQSYSQSKSLEKLSELNSDIEKLYKKYTEVKKERLLKEKSQQILVNRLKVLRSQQNSSKNKDNSDRFQKIHVKINSKYKKYNTTLRRYRLSGRKNINEIEPKFNYKTINNYDSDNKKENVLINSNNNNINSKDNYNNKSKKENTINGNFFKNKNFNSIEEFLKKNKCNIGNKNSNNNIYIIINNPNNCPDKKLENNDIDYQNSTPNSKANNNIDLIDQEQLKKHIKSEINLDLDKNGEKVILMNVKGSKIEDIINSINNINNEENKEIKKSNIIESKIKNNSNHIEKELNKNNIIISNKKKNDNEEINDNKEKIDNKDENNIVENNIQDNNIVNKKSIKENANNVDDESKSINNISMKNENKEIQNDNIKFNNNINNFDLNNNEEKLKKINNSNKNDMKNINLDEEFIRPNFLNLYKNEDSSLLKQKKDKNLGENKINFTPDKIINNNKKDTINNNMPKTDINNQVFNDIFSEYNNSNNQQNRKGEILQNKYNSINKHKNNSLIDDKNDIIYLNKKKLENMCKNNINNQDLNNNTIPVSNNEDNKSNKRIYTDDRSKNKKLINNNLYTPKKVDGSNKVKVNKKMDKSLTNQRTKDFNFLKNNNNFKINNNNNLINYSLSSINLNQKSNISSNYNNNYNTKRNINLEKFKNNNRKDTYCTSIEKKRKALGLHFRPNFEKELSIQNDKIKNRKIFGKFKIGNIILKNKVIKVNKKDEENTNMEGINATPQRFRIFKKNLENKNRKIFIKNKTTTDFNYGKKSINCEIKNNLNEIKGKNNRKINSILPNFSLSENNNNSSGQLTDYNFIFIANKTLNK